jgi:predicted nucleic acid-binding protein
MGSILPLLQENKSTNVPADLALLDTNVLVYAFFQDTEHHQSARALLNQARNPEAGLCLAPQILAEFFAVTTDPRRVTEPKSAPVVLDLIDKILALPGFTLLPVPVDLVSRWMELVQFRPVTRHEIFDVQLIATMLGNGVQRIYTFNRSDFEPYPQVQVISPELT